ncbi:hypothetical protein [Dyadobacter sandarakinus]|uniref:Lipocalin-like domain-containing protein n=1 Tax=Dyadobacter sandarakinus TaxID=2747268 RepID=A0ABX7I0Z2_9BACT|nr:hypothetical protein [Dyadobacter sandarakinus]QRQ99428.1 hypothetical protein HWI92_00120 [Dyadobacter sandarakinus]
MKRLLLFFPLLLLFVIAGCDKDKDENETPQLTEKDKILVSYPWRMTAVTDLNGKTIPNSQLNIETQAIGEYMDIQFLQNNVTKAIERKSSQVINGGTWYLINNNATLDIKVSGFSGEFGVQELTNSRLRLKSKMPVAGTEQETLMVFEPVIK